MMLTRIAIAALATSALCACTSAAQKQQSERARIAERVLSRVAPIADPGKVALRDIAMARAAQETGQWTALREFAATGAAIDAPGGLLFAQGVMDQLADPPGAASWKPKAVWSSCDGSLAVSFGLMQEASGISGSYLTAWQLQAGGEYRWIYQFGVPDDPQPQAAEREEVELDENVILVQRLEAIDGRAADCARAGDPPPPLPPVPAIAAGAEHEITRSADATLQYYWQHHQDGTREVIVQYLRGGSWEQVAELTATAP